MDAILNAYEIEIFTLCKIEIIRRLNKRSKVYRMAFKFDNDKY